MKSLVILGAGTAGTMVANRIRRQLPVDWALTVVDPEPEHLYQPGLLFLPFGARDERQMNRPRRRTLGTGVRWVEQAVEAVDLDIRRVALKGGQSLAFDLLVIASGSRIRPDQTEGMLGAGWRKSVHDFYTLEGAQALREALASFEGGRLVVDVVEMPIKCPVAPLEFLFLADAFFEKRGIRDDVELIFATPLDGAFTKPIANRELSGLLESKGIQVESEFNAGEVDGDSQVLRSYDERELRFDLLVSIPTHSGAEFIESSGLGDELAFVPTHPQTLQAREHDNVFVLGDAAQLPTSKAGSVAHFQSEVLVENLMHAIRGESLGASSDGHANCFIESGHGKGLLIDFNYETEPYPGSFPLPSLGPFTLLGETRINHLGKLGFRWAYWNLLLPARPLPIGHRMSMSGKRTSAGEASAAA